MNKGKRLIVTLMSSGMATAMSFVVSFFLTPFITNMLGTEAYGFVTLSKNFVSYAVIISTALDSYATRYIAMEYHKRDFDKANSCTSHYLRSVRGDSFTTHFFGKIQYIGIK